MSASDDVPYFSRFVVKFIEIFAAGLATAVSGYLIAHLAGALSSSTPGAVGTAIQAAPSLGGASSSPPANPPAPASADAREQHPAPVEEANPPADDAQSAQGTEPPHGDAAKLARKHLETDKHSEADKHLQADTSTAPSAAEGKRNQEENKHARDAVLARIRAALANSHAKRASPPDAPPPASNNGPRSAATIGSQPPIDKRPSAGPNAGPSSASVTLASPNSAKPPPLPIQPPIQQQVPATIQQQPPTEPTPLTTVEIPSRPVATVQTAPGPGPGPAPAPSSASPDDTGMFSGLDRLRHDPLAASEDAPRPPMPVGQ